MTQPTEQDRADFEAWISKPPFEYSTAKFGNGDYAYATVGFAWKAWQTAQAKMQACVAELEAICGNVPEGCTPADARVLREANHALVDEVAQAKWHKDIAEAALLSAEKERDKLAKRVEIRGDFCRTLEAAKQQVEDERDGLAAKCAEMERYNVQSIANRICGEIPDEFHVELVLENGAGWVSLFHKGKPVEIDMADWGIAEQFDVAMQCVQQIEREGGA